MTTKKSFILHLDSLDILDDLTDEQAGKLLKYFRDFNLGKEIIVDQELKLVFSFFKNQFVRDSEKYNQIVERNRSNGKGKKKKKPTRSQSQQVDATRSQSNPVATYNDNESDNKNENIIEKTQQEKFLDWFNNRVLDYSGKMGKTSVLSKTDENNLKKLRKSYPRVDDWNIVFKNMWKSQWCIETNNRTATHLLRVDNFNKYLSQENPFESIIDKHKKTELDFVERAMAEAEKSIN